MAHDLIADGVRSSTPPDELRRLHGAAAARAESRHPVDGAALAEVGHHRLAALPNEPDAAVEACLAAGNEALATAVPDEAAIWFERARSVVDGLGSAPPLDLAVELARGEALMRLGQPVRARPHLHRAARLARELEDAAALARAAWLCTADRIPHPAEDPESFALLEEAADALGEATSELAVRVLGLLSQAVSRVDPARSIRLADDVLGRVRRRRADSPALVALALNGRAMAGAGPDDVDQRVDLAGRALEAARRADDPESVVVARLNRVLALSELGRMTDADAELELARSLAAERHEPRWIWLIEGWDGVRALRLGHLDAAEDHFDRGLGAWEQPTPDALVGYGIQLTALRILQGRAAQILPVVRMSGVGRDDGPAWSAVRALVAAHAGEFDEAHRALGDAMASPPAGWIRDLTWTTTVSCAAEAAHLVGAETHARPLLAALEPHLHLHTVLTAFGSGGSYWGALCHPAGLSAALAGDRSRAATLLTQAVDEHDRLGAGPFAERSRRALADLER